MSARPSRFIAGLEWIYSIALHAYPREFRESFGSSIQATFAQRASCAEGSQLAAFFLHELIDVARSALDQHREAHRLSRRKRRRSRKERKLTSMELFVKDVRHALRSLGRSPVFTIVAISSLTLGIGANAAIFSFVDGALLRPMPVEEPERIVAVYATRSTSSLPLNFSYPNFADLQESDAFAEWIGFQGAPASLVAGGESELVWTEMVTASYFSGLGVESAAGRTLLPEEADSPGRAPVAVLSHDFWRRRFESTRDVVGRTVRLNGREFTIVGVAGPGFTGAKFLGFTPDLWVPLTMHEAIAPGSEGLLDRRRGGFLNVRARLAPGVSHDEARAALDVFAANLERSHPDVNRGMRLHLLPSARKTEPFLEIAMQGALPIASGVLFAVVGIVLLIACANVASLQLARSLGRGRELALRLSLGATRARLLRQLLLESLVLSIAAGALGYWLAGQLIRAAQSLSPMLDFAVDLGASLDGRVFAFTLLVSLFAGLLSGGLPALRASHRPPASALKEGGGSRSSRGSSAGRRWIVVPQIALSLVALVGAGLLVASFQNVRASDPGFSTEGIVMASVNLELASYDEERGRAFYRDVVSRLAARPGIDSVSLGSPLPLDAYTQSTKLFTAESDADREDEAPSAFYSVVDVGYFETMGTALLHGRGFLPGDDETSRPVLVVNETLAERSWPGESAIGKLVRFRPDGVEHAVVGVARTGKYLTLGEEARSYLFLPLRQGYAAPMTILVRSEAPSPAISGAIREEVRALDATLPVYGTKTMAAFLDRSLAGPRALAIVVSFFGVLAVVLATVGVYGLMSFSVTARWHELGIRMALGASRRNVLGLFLRQTALVVATGLGIGLVASWMGARAMSGLLFGVSATSPEVYAVVALLLGAAALLGGLLPSRRATRLDPLVTLRRH